MSLAPLLSSAKQDWRTPRDLFLAIERLWPTPFDLDAAADADNHLCVRWLGPGSPEGEDALVVPWRANRVWLNPPYGRALPQFVGAACSEVRQGHAGEVWLLVPARTDTRWWQQAIRQASHVWFLAGRVKFETATGASAQAPFPSAVIRLVRDRWTVRPYDVTWSWKP